MDTAAVFSCQAEMETENHQQRKKSSFMNCCPTFYWDLLETFSAEFCSFGNTLHFKGLRGHSSASK